MTHPAPAAVMFVAISSDHVSPPCLTIAKAEAWAAAHVRRGGYVVAAYREGDGAGRVGAIARAHRLVAAVDGAVDSGVSPGGAVAAVAAGYGRRG